MRNEHFSQFEQERGKEMGKMNSIVDLVQAGVLQLAKEARGNPQSLEGLGFGTFGIATKDYPAKTPETWNGVYVQLGLTYQNTRLICDPSKLGLVAPVFRQDPGYLGGDVGVGLKDKIPAYLDEVDKLAELAGSINVVLKQPDGRLVGHNTDGLGFRRALEEFFARRNERFQDKLVLILGAGGTGAAIAAFLAAAGVRTVILNRTAAKAITLAKLLNEHFDQSKAYGGGREKIADWLKQADVVVAVIDDPTSPLEQFVAFGEIPAEPKVKPTIEELKQNFETAQAIFEPLEKKPLVVDVMLRREPTATLQLAQQLGADTLDGVPMFVHQAIEAFWLIHAQELKQRGVSKDQIASLFQQAAAS